MDTPHDRHSRGDAPAAVHGEHLKRMVDYYDRTAVSYNQWHCELTAGTSHNHAVREILETMRTLKASSLLDVCCGTGRAVKAALDHGHNAIGLDASPALLKVGTDSLQIPAEKMILGDATQLPFPDASFDVSCVLGALHHTAQPFKIISEMIRVTRRAIVISDEANHFGGGIKQILVSLGLFTPLHRLIFHREPRTDRRQIESDGDGPTFVFSIEEIIPTLRRHFTEFRCLTFYQVRNLQLASRYLPRIFAKQGVITVTGKRPS